MELIQAVIPFDNPEEKASQVETAPMLSGYLLHYEHQHGKLYLGNSLEWLGSLKEESADLIFADHFC